MKILFTTTLLLTLIINSFAQKGKDSLTLYNRIWFKATTSNKALLPLIMEDFLKDSTIKSFKEIGKGTDFYMIELKIENELSPIINYLKSKGITAKFDKLLPTHICTTPVFVANDAWNDMGYWNSTNQNILKEKQLMDSIYWLVKDQYWNSTDDAGENVDLVITEIPNGNHTDLPQFDLVNSYDYYRNENINFANSFDHGSQVAGTAFAKINNGQDMVGMYNVKRPFINSASISSSYISTAALLSALSYAISYANSTGKKRIINISAAMGTDPDYEILYSLSDASTKTLIFNSAGNDGLPISQGKLDVKNNHPSVIIVQAGDGYGAKASFSSYEASISFKGTGRGVVNTGTSGTVSWQGTSLSSPGAAAATALLWSLLPTKTALEIKGLILDPKNYVLSITNPSGTKTPILKIGYLIQNLHFDIVHDYANPVNMAISPSINLSTSTHDIQGGTISNPVYSYQKNQTGVWVTTSNGTIATAALGVGTHNVRLEFDILHRVNKCASITRSIVVSNVAVTPVKLTTFTANTTSCNQATLQWQTSQEQNSKGFTIEQSANGVDFYTIGFVPSKSNGNSSSLQNYNFNTTTLSNGKIYFRLKQIDNDSRFEYSSTINTSIKCVANNLTITPNPANKIIMLQGLPVNSNRNFKIYDARGSLIFIGIANTFNEINIEQLASGMYYLKLDSGESLKFLKN